MPDNATFRLVPAVTLPSNIKSGKKKLGNRVDGPAVVSGGVGVLDLSGGGVEKGKGVGKKVEKMFEVWRMRRECEELGRMVELARRVQEEEEEGSSGEEVDDVEMRDVGESDEGEEAEEVVPVVKKGKGKSVVGKGRNGKVGGGWVVR